MALSSFGVFKPLIIIISYIPKAPGCRAFMITETSGSMTPRDHEISTSSYRVLFCLHKHPMPPDAPNFTSNFECSGGEPKTQTLEPTTLSENTSITQALSLRIRYRNLHSPIVKKPTALDTLTPSLRAHTVYLLYINKSAYLCIYIYICYIYIYIHIYIYMYILIYLF